MPPVNTKVSTTKDQYHHYIPRFILRYFQSGTPPSLTKRQRTISFRKALKTGVDIESIFFYDVRTEILQIRPVAKVYGRTNLYRDMEDLSDVDHLEAKFSRLENDASIVIKSIHASIPSHKFTTTRKELALLRKFIFLMHYRNDAVSHTYFQEDHPENAPFVDWIRNVKKTRGLKTDHDVWLHGLKYYLETPHHTMVAAAEWAREEIGDQRFQEMLRSRVAWDIEDWYAIDYETLANYFFLGIWEAADDSEFVLSGNGFGLWEGLIDGNPGAHRLYIVSPRIAIVLRRTLLQHTHPNDPAILYSCLAEIPIAQTHVQYTGESAMLFVDDDIDPELVKRARTSYRTSQKAQEDRFTLGITKLSRSQTYTVNEVLMLNINLHQHGSLSFSTASTMLDTVYMYMLSNNTFLGRKRSLFRSLLLELTDIQKASVAVARTPILNVDTDADVQLNMLLRFTVMKAIDFPSSYNRAYLIFHMATDGPSLHNAVSLNIRKLCFSVIFKLKSFLDPPCLPFMSNIYSRITETLPKEESELFFALVGHQVDQLDVGRYTNDLLGNIIYEAAIIGVTHWLAENSMEAISVIHTVYGIAKGLDNWLDERDEKDKVVRQISSIIQQIHGILLPLHQSLEKAVHIDEQQLIVCLKNIGDIMVTTRKHLLVWDSNRTNRLIAFFSPASVTKQLRDDEKLLNQQLLLLLVAVTLKEHIRGHQQSDSVVNLSSPTQKPPLDTKASTISTHPNTTEPESDVQAFWREFIGEKLSSISATVFCQQLAVWMQESINDVGAQRLLLWLDEAGIGRITLANVQQRVGTRNFRDAVVAFAKDPTLPLLICIGDNPENYSQQVIYALESNVTVVQLSSTAQAIAWTRINFAFLQRYDRPSYIRFIADNVRVKTDATSGTPLVNYSAGLNILRHVRYIGIKAPFLIRANTTIEATRFVEEFSMAGSTSSKEVCRDYIAALGAGENKDFGWRKFMA